MKKNYFLRLMVLLLISSANCAFAQSTFTKQIIIVNGGAYGDPDDYVTVSSYDPVTDVTTEFATIYTQSVQDMIIHGSFAYVAAQDSIVKLNIDTYEKLSTVAAAGVNKLATDGNVLLASFWYPITENFVRVFSLEDLSFITNVEGLSGEAADFLIYQDGALVAVPGPYGTTTGNIAFIDLNGYTLLSEDNFGEFYMNVGYFSLLNDEISVFMKTAYGETTSNSATVDMEGDVLTEVTHENAYLAGKTAQVQEKLYAEVNNGIGEFNLVNNELVNPTIVSPFELTIAASTFDTINSLFYITTSDFFSTGVGSIYNLNGELTGSFEAGISAQAIAIDYRLSTVLSNDIVSDNLNVYPNPSSDFININIPQEETVQNIVITDISGRVVSQVESNIKIDISSLNTGFYFIVIETNSSTLKGRFIKN